MLRALSILICVVESVMNSAYAQTITVMVAPFDGSKSQSVEVGRRVGMILDLQVWRTLVLPTSGEGTHSHGGVTWDVLSVPPTNGPEAEELARRQLEKPQIVLWGRAWKYGNGNVVEAFLSIRDSADAGNLGYELWQVSLDGQKLSVGYPHRQLEFAPIILDDDILSSLKDPGGLLLYRSPHGDASNGAVGDNFRAIAPMGDSEEVVLPDGRRGWVRLPRLSRKKNEVVIFTAALVRVMRRDWANAEILLREVAEDENVPTIIRTDSYLYLAVGAAHRAQDPLVWIRKAYKLDPYSKTIIQYLCMAHLEILNRMGREDRFGPIGNGEVQGIRDILDHHRALFSQNDAWMLQLLEYLGKSGRAVGVAKSIN